MNKVIGLIFSAVFGLSSCANAEMKESDKFTDKFMDMNDGMNLDTATLGAGCFWCVEAVFQELKGVQSVQSGYAGGFVKNPSYKEVCNGTTGHAEVAQIVYDADVLKFEEILEVFWKTHDPTTLNRQGNDTGTQYRSSIFYHNDEQKEKAEFYLKQIDESGAYPDPIVTTIEELTEFYVAEDYHQDYFKNNSLQPYCTFVIQPKLEKFRKAFSQNLK